MFRSMAEVKGAIEEGIGWLDRAFNEVTEDPEWCDHWPPLAELAAKLDAVLIEARKLLPLHPEIEADIFEESHRDDDY